jgi:hypothetical protein
MSIPARPGRPLASAPAGREEANVRYACLVYFEAKDMEALSSAELKALQRASLDYDTDLARRGHLVLAQALQSPEAAVTVRVRSGKVSTTDGPFAETKEQLAGFFLVEARDLNEAVQLASQAPMARIGPIEVRPVFELSRAVEEADQAARSAS